MTRVVVIGAGLAGLSAACHLVPGGHDRITVLERDPRPGGRGGRLDLDGFRWDTGPTVLTMPHLIDDALRAAGSGLDRELTLQRLDPAYRATYADGSTLRVRADRERMRAEIAAVCGERDAAAFGPFVAWLEELYRVEMPHFIERNYDSVLDLLRHPRAAARLVRLGGFGRLGRAVRARFDDPRLHRLFSFQAMYAGLAPDQALAIYAVITYMDSIAGVFYPAGGMHEVPAALARAAGAAGVELRFGQEVSAIRCGTGGAVRAVETRDGQSLPADAVVCTLDPATAYDRLLPDLPPPRVLRRGSYSPSALVWHLGVRGTPGPHTAHHNIHFGHAWAPAFDDLLVAGTRMRDPSRLVTVPTTHDAGAAPAGHSTLYVLEPVPNLAVGRIDWDQAVPALKEELLGFLQGCGYPTDVVADVMVTPQDWLRQGLAAGTPFALAHTFTQTGPFRPGNVEARRPGLVFAGSGTVPGVGVPMVLISGRLAAARVAELRTPDTTGRRRAQHPVATRRPHRHS